MRVGIAWLLVAGALACPTQASAQSFRFPTSDADYPHWYPTAYRDQGGTTDWACSSLTSSGHNGSDFGGGSWDGMAEGRDIVAAADGVVSYINDGEFDGCSTGDCAGGGGFGNYVKVDHGDGTSTYYAHMKTWSVAVYVGQSVGCGTKLGEMGSSGYSTGPHLHFEPRDGGNVSYDPFSGACSAVTSRWIGQGVHGRLPDPVCASSSPCSPVDLLTCGSVAESANNAAGSTTSHAWYGACLAYTYSGPEMAWTVRTDLSEPVTVQLTGNSADVDLIVLGDAACDGSSCVTASTNGDASDETVVFDATADDETVIVVDGWEGAVTSFRLEVICNGDLGDDEEPVDTAPPDPVDTEDTAVVDSATDTAYTDPDDPDPYPPLDDEDDVPPGWSDPDGTFGPGQRLSPDGCGCASRSGPLHLTLPWLLALAAAARRRRQMR